MFNKIYNILLLINVFLIANPIPPDGYDFNQSQRQAFYIFTWTVINADTLDSEGGHWIGAFNLHDETNGGLCENISEECPDINNDGLITEDAEICVGSAQVDTLSYVSLPVMGADSLLVDGEQLCEQTGTCYYLNTGEIPVFKIYDTSLDSSLSAIPSSEEPFIDLEVYLIDLLEHESYLDYNSIPLYEGNNLISFWALPWENSVEDIFGDMQYVLSVAGEALISTYDDGNWSGSLETINRNSGYWVTVSDDEVLNVFGIASETDLGYSLDNYKNLISFPSPIQTSITDAIPDNVENSFLGIIGQGSAAQLINSSWEGTLEYFEGTNGYWALINDPIEFNFIIDGSRSFSAEKNNSMIEISNQFQYNISMNQAFYFIDNIYLENKPLEENHIIITYCNDNIVGSRVWNKKIIDQPAMGYDGTEKTIGYCYDGQIPNFKLYNPNTNKMIQLDPSVQFEWSNNTFYNINLSSSEIISNPNGFTIENIYPNPFNGNISINYTIQKPGNFSVEIIDLNGRLIEFIEKNSFHDIGAYYSNWDSGINSSGTYFVKITDYSNNQNIIQKLMLIK